MTLFRDFNVILIKFNLISVGFSFGYGGLATVILQYRVTLFAIPLVPVMEKFVVTPLKSFSKKETTTSL